MSGRTGHRGRRASDRRARVSAAMTPEATTDTDLNLLGRAKEYIRRSYRTWRIGPLVGIAEACILLDVDRQTIYRWKAPGSDVAATSDALSVLAAAGKVSDEEHDECVMVPYRSNDLRIDRAALGRLIARLRADGDDRAAEILSDCTHMPRPAMVGGREYAAVLRARAVDLRADAADPELFDDLVAASERPDGAVDKRVVELLTAAKDAEKGEGRAVWLLDDIEAFRREIGRIRAPRGQAKPRGSV